MAEEHHPLKPFYSVLVLAFGCSVLVAAAAVGLRPLQEANRTLDQKKNILSAAGIYQPDRSIVDQFNVVETRLVNLKDGSFIPPETQDPDTYNQRSTAMSDETGQSLNSEDDIAGIRRLENYVPVYLVRDNGKIAQVVLPVRGKGLWSTMYAYVAVESDLSTIRGISFYEHGETPGLGGEVENPRWQSRWREKKLFGSEGEYLLSVVKNSSQSPPDQRPYLVDGISGATITSQGVDKLMKFWFGDHGYQPFFERIRNEGGFNG